MKDHNLGRPQKMLDIPGICFRGSETAPSPKSYPFRLFAHGTTQDDSDVDLVVLLDKEGISDS